MRRLMSSLIVIFCSLCLTVTGLIGAFSFLNPPFTALMLWRLPNGYGMEYSPLSIDQISSELTHAVLTSEDNNFCEHRGIDWDAVILALNQSRAENSPPRGASTITMQTAKNLFLTPKRSYIRKLLEAPIALVIDLFWSKRRIMEVYLNIAEWGPGIYGAENAARTYFNRPASELSRRQSALLAAALPDPLLRNAAKPGPVTSATARRIELRMAQTRGLFSCIDKL
jgi:monofunctional biosynthetic peptidoglycan transglycosylase